MRQIKSPELVGASEPSLENNKHKQNTKPTKKWERVLAAFACGRSLNRFEAERELHDHCLHSTVSAIQEKGVSILRHDEIVPGFQGSPTHVMRYRLSPDHRQKALYLLGIVRAVDADSQQNAA